MEINWLTSTDDLNSLYGDPVPTSLAKVVNRMTPEYRDWISQSRFCVLSTVGPEGTDATPRGDDGPVVALDGDKTLLMPDWAGNNRLDSLRNIIRDPRCSLMFLIPGNTNVVRINGTGRVTADKALRAGFEKAGKLPKTVLVVTIGEMYFQCAKALMRSDLWDGPRPRVPTAGDFLRAVTNGREGGAAYDSEYPERARRQFWERSG